MLSIDFTLHIAVNDPIAFAQAAVNKAVFDGVDKDDAEQSAYPGGRDEEPDLTWCGIMLFDPGTAPAGSEIIDSSSNIQEV